MSKRITVEEIAEQMHLGVETVRSLLRRGEIPCIRLTRRYVISRAAFEHWLETCGTKPSATLQ